MILLGGTARPIKEVSFKGEGKIGKLEEKRME